MARTEFEFTPGLENLPPRPKKKSKFISKLITYLLVIFVILGISYSVGIISSTDNLSKNLGGVGLWQQLKNLIGKNDQKLSGETEDRINVLLLGIGGFDDSGKQHDGPQLTDTIILASFKPSTKQVALISIPRDLIVQIPGNGWRKVNAVNAIGEAANPGHGPELTAEIISNIFDQPIQYYVRLDFTGFQKVVDNLGGIDVEVENTLDDYAYPVPGKEMATTSLRYEHLHVEEGLQHMDGNLALKFVRSRKALGIEGSDFARSRRQQKVLMAIKEKALSFGTLINPYRITNLMDTLSQHLLTNIQAWEILKAYDLGKSIKEADIVHHVFDDGPTGSLVQGSSPDGAYILQPKSGNYNEMRMIARNIFDTAAAENQKSATQVIKPKTLEIRNGTNITGLAYRTSDYLESLGYKINKFDNAPTRDYKKTVVYNLVTDAKDTTAKKIAEILKADVTTTLPDWVKAAGNNGQIDIIIVLGQDNKDL
ncbi:MAG: LCP family protein [Candidatus Buchananbacteria bacterium]